jgi:hypothetical protein
MRQYLIICRQNDKVFTLGIHLCNCRSNFAFPEHPLPLLEPFSSFGIGDAIQVGKHDLVLLGHKHGFGLEELGPGLGLQEPCLGLGSKAFVLASTSKSLALAIILLAATECSWRSTKLLVGNGLFILDHELLQGFLERQVMTLSKCANSL